MPDLASAAKKRTDNGGVKCFSCRWLREHDLFDADRAALADPDVQMRAVWKVLHDDHGFPVARDTYINHAQRVRIGTGCT